MFGIGLRLRQKWSKFKLRKNKEITAQQVHETNVGAMALGLFFKMTVLVFFALIVLFPFFFMLMISLMGKQQALELQNKFTLFPREWTWSNFKVAAESSTSKTTYWPAFGLTFCIVLFSIVVKTLITMLAGYAFSLKKWKGKNILWSFFIALLVLPEVALLVGQYRVVTELDKITNIKKIFMGMVAVISLPFIASIFSALMFRNAFEAIPSRIKEVATVDGATGAKYFFKVAVPMIVPTMLTVIILTALASWNSYLWPNLVSNNDFQVLSIWLFSVGQDNSEQVPRVFQSIKLAGAILSILPMFAFYLLFRKRIMSAISRQGSTIKG